MGKDKSILEKFTDAVKDIASTATDAASQALKTDESALRADERAAAYIPLAADGLVSDPLMVPPVAPERRKPAAKKRGSAPAAGATKARAAKARTTKARSAKNAAEGRQQEIEQQEVRSCAEGGEERQQERSHEDAQESPACPINDGGFRPSKRSSRIARISLRAIQTAFAGGQLGEHGFGRPSPSVLRKAITFNLISHHEFMITDEY